MVVRERLEERSRSSQKVSLQVPLRQLQWKYHRRRMFVVGVPSCYPELPLHPPGIRGSRTSRLHSLWNLVKVLNGVRKTKSLGIQWLICTVRSYTRPRFSTFCRPVRERIRMFGHSTRCRMSTPLTRGRWPEVLPRTQLETPRSRRDVVTVGLDLSWLGNIEEGGLDGVRGHGEDEGEVEEDRSVPRTNDQELVDSHDDGVP